MPTAQAAQSGCPAACFAAPSEDQGLRRPARQTPGSLSFFGFNFFNKEAKSLGGQQGEHQETCVDIEVKSVGEPGF